MALICSRLHWTRTEVLALPMAEYKAILAMLNKDSK